MEKNLKITLINPGKFPLSPSYIKCFSDVYAYYIHSYLIDKAEVTTKPVSGLEDIDPTSDANICLGLRYFSNIPKESIPKLNNLYQIYDGSRLDNEPVFTFTLKDDYYKYKNDPSRLERHLKHNKYIGWAADHTIFYPQQTNELTFLIDHTNYGPNKLDYSHTIKQQVKEFIDSKQWQHQYKSCNAFVLDSGRVVDYLHPIDRYDRSIQIPYTEIAKIYNKAHVFFVTHPESLGQTALETAMSGALIVTPKSCLAPDRLNTINHYAHNLKIDWDQVLENINPEKNRERAIENSWDKLTDNIINHITSQ